MKKLLIVTLSFISTAAVAKTLPCPGSFGVDLEYLYWNIGQDEPFFALDRDPGTNNLSGAQYANSATWHSGVRAELLYRFCDDQSGLRLRSTYFPQFSNSLTTANNVQLESNGNFLRGGSVTGRSSFNFVNAELLYDHDLLRCCPFSMSVQAGLQFLYLREKITENTTPPSDNDSLWRSKRIGIGPEIGAELEYVFSSCFALEMRTWGALLVAQKKGEFFDGFGDTVTDETYWKFIPAADMRFGVNYTTPFNWGCSCFALNLEVGYEFLYYSESFSKFNFFDNVSFNQNFFGHGPYIQLGAAF